MTTESKYTNLPLEIKDVTDLGNMVVCLYEKDILHIIAKTGRHIDMDTLKLVLNHIDFLGKKKYYLITEFEEFADSDPKVREWKASSAANIYKHAEAIVINNSAQKLVANFYLIFNKPRRPTKVFTSLPDSLKWILNERMKKEDFFY